jgi:hypothetical protein
VARQERAEGMQEYYLRAIPGVTLICPMGKLSTVLLRDLHEAERRKSATVCAPVAYRVAQVTWRCPASITFH